MGKVYIINLILGYVNKYNSGLNALQIIPKITLNIKGKLQNKCFYRNDGELSERCRIFTSIYKLNVLRLNGGLI